MKSEKKYIYICTRLYNYNDKIQAEYLEEEIISNTPYNVFVPFRDSNEHLLNGPNKTRLIYDTDIEKLNSSQIVLLAVLFDGLYKDEGISFEIGYAYGKGIPVFIINTDFIWYTINGVEFSFDPIISFMSTGSLHYFKIIPCKTFKESLFYSQKQAFHLAVEKIKQILSSEIIIQKPIQNTFKRKSVFIDFGGCKYEYQRENTLWIKEQLQKHKISVNISNRYKLIQNTLSINQIGEKDINNMLQAELFVCSGDEVEMNSGTASLLGLAKSVNKKIILYESSDIEILGENNHHMKKNLMIDFSVTKTAKNKQQLLGMILEELHV